MDVNMSSHASGDQLHARTQLLDQFGVQHVCDHRCHVEMMFGNVYRCQSSGQVHCCDSNCQQRVYHDRYSTICRISKKVFYHTAEPDASRKRSGCSSAVRDQRKRVFAADTLLEDDVAGDAMVM